MREWITERGICIKQLLSGRANVYLVITPRLTILVDTGKSGSFKKIIQHYHASMGKAKLDYLILTHTHFDHCENAARVKEQFDCRIILHKSESDLVRNGFTPLPKGTNPFTALLSEVGNKYRRSTFAYLPFQSDIEINESYRPEEDDTIEVISTPGHSQGSISIIVDNEIAIVGDTIFGVFPNRVFPPFADQPGLMIQSWEKLLNTSCQTFLPGHGEPVSLNTLIKEYQRYKKKWQ